MKKRTAKAMLILLLTSAVSLCSACGNAGNTNTPEKPDAGTRTEVQAETDSQAKPDAGTGTEVQAETNAQAESGEAEAKSSEAEEVITYQPLSEGDAAPDFTASLADGSTFTLSGQQGKIVLLNFWATWCGPCVREMPAFERLYTEYEDTAVILAVNCLEDTGTVNAFIAETGYSFPIAYDADGSVNMRYPTQGIPYTLVIDGEGIIRKICIGAADAETQYQEYKSAIDEMMKEEPS